MCSCGCASARVFGIHSLRYACRCYVQFVCLQIVFNSCGLVFVCCAARTPRVPVNDTWLEKGERRRIREFLAEHGDDRDALLQQLRNATEKGVTGKAAVSVFPISSEVKTADENRVDSIDSASGVGLVPDETTGGKDAAFTGVLPADVHPPSSSSPVGSSAAMNAWSDRGRDTDSAPSDVASPPSPLASSKSSTMLRLLRLRLNLPRPLSSVGSAYDEEGSMDGGLSSKDSTVSLASPHIHLPPLPPHPPLEDKKSPGSPLARRGQFLVDDSSPLSTHSSFLFLFLM